MALHWASTTVVDSEGRGVTHSQYSWSRDANDCTCMSATVGYRCCSLFIMLLCIIDIDITATFYHRADWMQWLTRPRTSVQGQGLGCKAKALTFKDKKIVLKDYLRPRPKTNITGIACQNVSVYVFVDVCLLTYLRKHTARNWNVLHVAWGLARSCHVSAVICYVRATLWIVSDCHLVVLTMHRVSGE